MSRRLRSLLFSTLYPSAARPGHGQFIETRLRELLATGEVQARVVAPVPWFFSTHPRFGERARMALTPSHEVRHGIAVDHPRYLLPPKVGETVAPFVLAAGALGTLRRLQREGFDFDLIDAHYFYPDGVAAALLGRWLRKPVVITARGSDLNVLGHHRLPRRMMQWAVRQSSASAGVCQSLADVLRSWGAPAHKVHVLRNGVDLQRFTPVPRGQARQRLGLGGEPLVVSVGNLVPIKGHELTLQTLAQLATRHPEARLVIVGDGPERASLQARAESLGLQGKVAWPGRIPNEDLAPWYSAADVTMLSSHNEGWANVLLESMACGTPVLATDVGGSAEVVAHPHAGRLLPRRDPALAAGLLDQLVTEPPQPEDVRRYAEQFSWAETSSRQLALFRSVTARSP